MAETTIVKTSQGQAKVGHDDALRIPGAAFVIGGVITLLFNVLHPLPGGTLEETMRIIVDAGVGFWKADHLMLTLGLWLLAAGFSGLRHSLATGPTSTWARFGFYGVLATTAAWTMHFALDGIAWAHAIEAWDQATGARKEALLDSAALLRHVTDGTFPMTAAFYWLSLLVIGVAVARGGRHPAWSGWALVLVSAGVVTLSIVAMFSGFSTAWDISFAALASLTTLWTIGMGIWLLRTDRGSVATARAEDVA